MDKVTVYYFTECPIRLGDKIRSKTPATEDTIKKREGAEILKETAQEVDISQIDGNGFLKKS